MGVYIFLNQMEHSILSFERIIMNISQKKRRMCLVIANIKRKATTQKQN